MLVTINTDASYSNQYKVGAFAFYIICDEFKILKSGSFKDNCISPDDAEAKCITNALKELSLKDCRNIDKIIINTDSLNAIALLEDNDEHIKRYMSRDIKKLRHIRKTFEKIANSIPNLFIIEFRHVKSHSGINDKRSHVNEWCDVNAKKCLRTKIEEVNNAKNRI